MTAQDAPSQDIHSVKLSCSDGDVQAVNLYQNRAEITRLFKLSVKKGQNDVEINGLSSSMDKDSLRVEGHGPATIHDVNLKEKKPNSSEPDDNTILKELQEKRARIEKAGTRCNRALLSLENFVGAATPEHTKCNEYASVMEYYETTGARLDEKLLNLEQQLKQIDQEIKKHRGEQNNTLFGRTIQREGIASIGVVAESDSDVELTLTYAVRNATWKAAYDLRADTSKPDKPITLVYKAIVTQSTGEAWNNVSLTLETRRPEFGFKLPSLQQWTIKPRPVSTGGLFGTPNPTSQAFSLFGSSALPAVTSGGLFGAQQLPPNPSAPTGASAFGSTTSRPSEEPQRPMEHSSSSVGSQGSGVAATFKVPGCVTVPSNEGERSFTITTLELDALLTWFSIPKVDSRAHLKASFRNDSDYTLLPGKASVYVDGSFAMKTDIPQLGPNERLECSLGSDPSIRITYHPLSKKSTTSGFYQKSTTYAYEQRLTIHNTKSNTLPYLKIVDQIPVPEHSEIMVKLINPALKEPCQEISDESRQRKTGALTQNASLVEVVAASIGPNHKVKGGVVAAWDGADDPDVDLGSFGKNGKINWLCEVPAKEKLNLALQWEVGVPQNMDVTGL